MKKLEIIDLHVEVEGKEIVKGITLTFFPGKVHAIMGPNGSGKSSLAHAIMGHPKYKITKGKILLDGIDITHLKSNKKAQAGLFLSFQYPAEITGVTLSTFLRTASENLLDIKHNILDFHKDLKIKLAEVGLNPSFGKRYLNEGFSGGEKKKSEILQLKVLEPKYAFLDEVDSGSDVDSIKAIAQQVTKIRQKNEMSLIVITHYNRFLEYLQPDEVSIIHHGKIISQGTYDLAKEIEINGFEGVISNAN
jgi:Fe-S cluster assembly ATP-binding protein